MIGSLLILVRCDASMLNIVFSIDAAEKYLQTVVEKLLPFSYCTVTSCVENQNVQFQGICSVLHQFYQSILSVRWFSIYLRHVHREVQKSNVFLCSHIHKCASVSINVYRLSVHNKLSACLCHQCLSREHYKVI